MKTNQLLRSAARLLGLGVLAVCIGAKAGEIHSKSMSLVESKSTVVCANEIANTTANFMDVAILPAKIAIKSENLTAQNNPVKRTVVNKLTAIDNSVKAHRVTRCSRGPTVPIPMVRGRPRGDYINYNSS